MRSDAGSGVPQAPDRLVHLALGLLGLWLAAALLLVDIDLDDGYATVANAQHFLGLSEFYAFIRGPLMGLLLVPAEWLANALGRPPLEVRAHHALMALLHMGYLLGSWRLLCRVHPAGWPRALAWLAAVPSVVFFSYAPYISHDLFPGLLALWMVFLAHGFLAQPGTRRWLGLVALGAALPLLKQTYALVWVAIMLTQPLLWLADRDEAGRGWRVQAALLAAATASALLAWLGYAWSLSRDFADVPFWWRPAELMLQLTRVYADEGGNLSAFFQGLYFRNLSAYGVLAMVLVVPGAALALVQGDARLRRVAAVWLVLLVALLLTPLKEVRYLAVLAPFNALLMVPLLQHAWRARPLARVAVVAVLVLDLGLRLPEALRIADPWYRTAVHDFFAPLAGVPAFQGTLYMGQPLAFIAPGERAFFGDRYHRITHVSIETLVSLERIPFARARKLAADQIPPVAALAPGDVWIHANRFLARTEPFVAGNRAGLAGDFQQFLAIAEWVQLEPDGAGGLRVTGSNARAPRVLLAPGRALFGVEVFTADSVTELLGRRIDAPLRLLGFRVHRLCTLGACQREWPPR